MMVMALVVCIIEAFHVINLLPNLDVGAGKIPILFVATFWLIILLLDIQQKHYSDAWTYRTERELLLGLITTKDALQRIEQRYLGAKLSEVIDDFWREISIQQEYVKKLLQELKDESAKINVIPTEYSEERRSRSLKAVKPVSDALNKLIADHEEFSSYSKEMMASQTLLRNKKIIDAIKNMNSQHSQSLAISKALAEEFNIERKALDMHIKLNQPDQQG